MKRKVIFVPSVPLVEIPAILQELCDDGHIVGFTSASQIIHLERKQQTSEGRRLFEYVKNIREWPSHLFAEVVVNLLSRNDSHMPVCIPSHPKSVDEWYSIKKQLPEGYQPYILFLRPSDELFRARAKARYERLGLEQLHGTKLEQYQNKLNDSLQALAPLLRLPETTEIILHANSEFSAVEEWFQMLVSQP